MTSVTRLTFAQFQAAGRDSADLRVECPDYYSTVEIDGGTDAPIPGRAYLAEEGYQLAIERNPEGNYVVETGTYWTSGTLLACEKELYGFYVAEIADDDVRAELMEQAPENRYFVRPSLRNGEG